jgi:hypothetical protein
MDLQDLFPIAVTFVALGVLIGFGLSVQSSIKEEFVTYTASCGRNSTGGTGATILYTGCGADYNSSVKAIEANSNLSSKLPVLATIVVAAIVVGVLIKSFVLK